MFLIIRCFLGLSTLENMYDLNQHCPAHGKFGEGHIRRHSFYITRQGNSYLGRKTACQAREQGYLAGNMSLMMCFYNFLRPHSALRCGNETRTPAMQAGLASKRLSFRDVFTSRVVLFLCLIFLVVTQRGKTNKRTRNGPSPLTTVT